MVKRQLAQETLNIALTGLMGSGKSTVGKFLARQLGMNFVDTDALIEERESKSVREIFETEGEDYFRELETRVIKELLKNKGQVISLGGGAIVSKENRSLLKKKTHLIALVADPVDLNKRIRRRKTRPLLNTKKTQLVILQELWQERKQAYYDSHIQIDTEAKSINLIATEIIKALGLKKPKLKEFEIAISRTDFCYKVIFKDISRINIDHLDLGKKLLIVSQKPIAKHYLSTVQDRLSKSYQVDTLLIENGEDAKNFFTYQTIMQKLLALKFERKDTLVALGGGVVGDIVGFAAATYYRGINYIQVPTTLLAMIDSSVGGKTAINVSEGKNLIGSFYQPHMVYVDVDNLQTLPGKEFKSGLGELVKYCMLGADWDADLGDSFFDYLMSHADEINNKEKHTLNQVINHCIRIKAGIVAQDETEKGKRAFLNLGHTFGHAIEEVTKYQVYSHGEAVAKGLVCACYLSEALGLWRPANTEKVIALLDKFEIDYKIPSKVKTQQMLKAFSYDKKAVNGVPRFIIPKAVIGNVDFAYDANAESIIEAIDRNR